MPILVVCPGCKKSFQVSDQYAGRKGPCPTCKTVITIPKKEEEVVIHAPEPTGPKTATGEAVLKPIVRQDARWNPLLAAGIAGAVLLVFGVAFILRGSNSDPETFPLFILAVGAVVLAPPLVLGGYTFLRDDELAPYRGAQLYLRVGICSLVFALLWLLPTVAKYALNLDGPFELPHFAMLGPAMVAVGALASLATCDLPYGMAAFHYALYLAAGVLLRLVMGLPAL